MKSVLGLALISCIALDTYVATVLSEEWYGHLSLCL